MTRLILVGLLVLGACAASAQVITEYHDEVFLRDHETVRYRVDIDFSVGGTVDLDVLVRGINAPPRVRVLDSGMDELKDVRDTDGDWTLDFDITLGDVHDHYFVEVDSAWPDFSSDMDVRLRVEGDELSVTSADIFVDRFFTDHESGDDSDHCVAGLGGGSWALVPLAGLAVLAARRRRRNS